jgi:UPF0755 protein
MSKKILIALLAIAIFGGGIIFKDKLVVLWYSAATTSNTQTKAFFISKPMDLLTLSNKLKEEGIVKTIEPIKVLGTHKKLTLNNIALGKYEIAPNTSLRTLLNGFHLNSLGNGNAEVEVDVVVPNVRFLEDLAGKLSEKTIVDSAEFISLLSSKEILEKYDFTREQLPALFIPNTYKMYYDTDAKSFISRMAKEFKNYWTPARREALKTVGLNSPSEAVTLASIVYSEQSRQKSEWPIIAGLYLNRIHQGIPLQSDPTFKFCWGKKLDTVQRLLNEHRNIKCDYNTYFIKGLPPGPICIPPLGVVSAVLNPAKHDYIFMVAEPSYSGKHLFAKNYSEHNANAKIFQSWLASELAKKINLIK